MDQRIEKLMKLVSEKYDNGDPGHDFAHILRVVDVCKKIGEKEKADLEILIPAALLHDVINIPKNHPNREKASEFAAAEASEILKKFGFKDLEITKISQVIIEHSYSLGRAPSCLESAILQDADRLDAMGAIGLMRMVSCGTLMGSKFYEPVEPIPKNRELNDKAYAVDHLYVKLFKLKEKMNTEFGREEAERRSRFMEEFVSQLGSELP